MQSSKENLSDEEKICWNRYCLIIKVEEITVNNNMKYAWKFLLEDLDATGAVAIKIARVYHAQYWWNEMDKPSVMILVEEV